ncbi:DUF6471 domain-containing protein [Marivita lacus]|uniref:DUF6471 domain-containing protein n=1 Tax=Marivita lacus TaxID=1323742 RepID=UPI0027E457FD|nr:DUF6471 domain-containing protein [Marivita lacus]
MPGIACSGRNSRDRKRPENLPLKAELKRSGVTYVHLAEMVGDKEPSVRNEPSMGKFSATFMLQSLEAIGVSALQL